MHAECWYGSESCSYSALEAGLAFTLSQRYRMRVGLWGELYPLLPQPWTEDKKAWFKLELQSESNPPGLRGEQGSDPHPLQLHSDLCVDLCCAALLSYCSLWVRVGVAVGWRCVWHQPWLVSGAVLQQAVNADAEELLPAPELGQLGVYVTRWTLLSNAHCTYRAVRARKHSHRKTSYQPRLVHLETKQITRARILLINNVWNIMLCKWSTLPGHKQVTDCFCKNFCKKFYTLLNDRFEVDDGGGWGERKKLI